jgi:hypothetical protein
MVKVQAVVQRRVWLERGKYLEAHACDSVEAWYEYRRWLDDERAYLSQYE